MSLKLNERYPARFNNPSSEYPLGSFKNRTAPNAKDGSYLEQDWANDKEGFFQSLLSAAGIDANGSVDKVGASQFYDAFLEVIQDHATTPQATESELGGAKVATQSQTNDGTDDATIVTPKKLFAAQQTALNLKMNLTGDGAVPRLGAVSVNSSGLNANRQGAYLFWNETGDGRASLLNNQGDGIGGFIFRNINKDNTAETGRVTIDGSGSLSSTGNISASGDVWAGSAVLGNDGNVNGSVWGGWLSSYIANYVNTNVPLVCAAQGASGVGTYALLYIPGKTQAPGWLVNGNSLYWSSASGGGGGIVGIGTWRLMGYINMGSAALGASLFLRVS